MAVEIRAATYAALRTALAAGTYQEGQAVYVETSDGSNRGAAGWGHIEASGTDNGVTIIANASGLAWVRDNKNPVCIQWAEDYVTNTSDCAAALQAAHDALGPDGGAIYIPASNTNYLINTKVVFTKPIRLVGDNWYSSEFLVTTNVGTVIESSSRLCASNIHWTAIDSAAGFCTFISILSNATNHGKSAFENCYFSGHKVAYRAQRANSFSFHECAFAASGTDSVNLLLENTTNSDEGDSFISSCWFAGDSTQTIGVSVLSTSGINFSNNKFLQEKCHVRIAANAGNVGNFLFSNNSFEGHKETAIYVDSSAYNCVKTIITGNQFSSDCDEHLFVGDNALNTVIAENSFNTSSPSLGVGVRVVSGAENVLIADNLFYSIANGIILPTANNSAGQSIKGNRFADTCALPISGGGGVNARASSIDLSISKFVSTTSDSVYTSTCRFKGVGVLDIKVYGIVQGVSSCGKARKVLFTDTTVSDIDAVVSVGGSFDLQVATSGGYMVVGVKRATGIGTSLTVYVEVSASGQVTHAEYL